MDADWLLVGQGILAGMGLSFIWRKIREWIHRFRLRAQAWMERRPRVQAEIARIEGAFRLETFVPNAPPPLTFGERIRDRWDEFWSVTNVRTPEGVAQAAYERALARLR